MPATAVLLKRLQETLGEEATRDLVTWVDQGWEYQIAQLRELADLHYGRFDARLEQRLAEVRAALRTEMAQGLAAVRQDLAQGVAAVRQDMTQGLAAVRQDMAQGLAAVRQDMTQGLGAARAETTQGLAAVRAEMAQGDASLRAEIAALRIDMATQRADLIKWMFVFWAGTVIPIAGLVVALVKL
jgi:hypothetical protein